MGGSNTGTGRLAGRQAGRLWQAQAEVGKIPSLLISALGLLGLSRFRKKIIWSSASLKQIYRLPHTRNLNTMQTTGSRVVCYTRMLQMIHPKLKVHLKGTILWIFFFSFFVMDENVLCSNMDYICS